MATTGTPDAQLPTADFPLTCEFCRHEPATHLAVYDITIRGRAQRVQKTIGSDCAAWNFPDRPRDVAASPGSVWLFRLVPEEAERLVRPDSWECPRCHCLFERAGFDHEPCRNASEENVR